MQSALRYAETFVRCRVAQVTSVLPTLLSTTAGKKDVYFCRGLHNSKGVTAVDA
jgi:hypothetical protein